MCLSVPKLQLSETANKMKSDQLELQDTSPNSSSTGSLLSLTNSNNGFEDFSYPFPKKLKVYPAKNRKPLKSYLPDFDESPESQPERAPRRIDPTSRIEVMKNRPRLAYQRFTGPHPSGAKGELQLFYNCEEIKSDPNIYCNIPSEMKAEFEESKRIGTSKALEKLLSSSSSFTFENVVKNFLEDFKIVQERMAILETLLKSEKMEHSKMELLKKVSIGYEQINTLMENISKDIKSTKKSEEEIQHSPKNEAERLKEKQLVDSGDLLKNGTAEILKKEVQEKTFFEKYICTLGFTIDENKRELKAVFVEQMYRAMDSHFAVNEMKPSKMSLSSGSLADHSSLSESNSGQSLPKLPFQLSGRHSIPESSSTSSGSVQSGIRHSHQFIVPSAVVDRSLHYNRPKTCFCNCYCTLLKQNDFVFSSTRSIESFAASQEILSSSLENSCTKIEGVSSKGTISYSKEDFVKGISSRSSNGTLSEEILPYLHESCKSEKNTFPEESKVNSEVPISSTPSKVVMKEKDQQQELEAKLPITKDLFVFGCWRNKYYPGKLEGVTEEVWNDSDEPFNVIFLDGTSKLLANVYIVPVSKINAGVDIMCDVENDLCIEGTLVEIKKYNNPKNEESLQFIVKIEDEIRSFPFENVWFYKLTIKQLGVTPRKPQVLHSGAPLSILEGKRQLRSQFKTPHRDQQEAMKSTVKKPLKKARSSITLEGKPSSSSVRHTREKKSSNYQQGVKRKKSATSDEEDKKDKRSKLKKKLEFESQPCTSSSFTISSARNLPEIKSESKSSETELSDTSRQDYFEDSDLDAEFITDVDTAKKCLERTKIKSAIKVTTQEEQDTIHTLGPIQKSTVFSGFNFILTHSDRTKLLSKRYSARKKDSLYLSASNTENDESGSFTDFEEQVENCVPFDYMRLKMQIQFGGGIVYESVTNVDIAEYSKTITISDYPCQTPNYLLSIAVGIPIYRHDLIINCCKEDSPIVRMLKFGFLLPTGRSLENGTLLERTRMKFKKPLSGYMCAINVKKDIKFWRTILMAMGASVNSTGYGTSNISFIVADKHFSKESLAREGHVPVVSKTWVIQTLLHGEPRGYLNFPEYNPVSKRSENSDKDVS